MYKSDIIAKSYSSTTNHNNMEECSICFSDFDQPKQLPCLHNFCLKCLKTYCREEIDGDMKSCPLCRTEFCIPQGGVEKLPNNEFMMRLVLIKKSNETNEKKQNDHACDLCKEVGEKVEAKSFCKECNQCLCTRCKKIHSVASYAKNHTVTGIEEKPSNETLQKMQSFYCTIHPGKEIELFCLDCNILLCYVCHFESHGKHNCKLLQEISQGKKEEFVKDDTRIKRCRDEVCGQLKNLQIERDKACQEASEAKKNIEEACDNMVKLIATTKTRLVDNLEHLKASRLKEICSQEDLDQMRSTALTSFTAYSRMVMERGTDCEIIRVADELHKRAEELIKSQDERNKQQLKTSCIKFITSPEPTPEEAEKLIGRVMNSGEADKTIRFIESNAPPTATSVTVNERVTGVAVLDDLLYVVYEIPGEEYDYSEKELAINPFLKIEIQHVHEADCAVKVYDLLTGETKPSIDIREMIDPTGLTASAHSRALYITDRECIHMVNVTNNTVKQWKLGEDYEPQGVSVTLKHNILITVNMNDFYFMTSSNRHITASSRILEYTPEGSMIREILLESSIERAQQTIQLSTDQLIICHGIGSTHHTLSVINSEGRSIKNYNIEKGGSEYQQSEPCSLAINNNSGHIFFADNNNNNVLMFDRNLTLLGQAQILHDLVQPSCLHFDSNSDRVAISDHPGAGYYTSRISLVHSSSIKLKK